jgi:hypothetical protein
MKSSVEDLKENEDIECRLELYYRRSRNRGLHTDKARRQCVEELVKLKLY